VRVIFNVQQFFIFLFLHFNLNWFFWVFLLAAAISTLARSCFCARLPNTATGIIAARKPISHAIFIASANTSEIGTVERAVREAKCKRTASARSAYVCPQISFKDWRAPETDLDQSQLMRNYFENACRKIHGMFQ